MSQPRLRSAPWARAVRAYGPALTYRWTGVSDRFVILTAGRTGSELLVSLLDSHPQISCDSEILAERRAFPEALIRSRAALAGLRRARVWGFKLLRDHLLRQNLGDPGEFVRALQASGYRVILLERRDLLQQAISYVRAAGAGYHHLRSEVASFEPRALDPLAVLATMFVIEDAVEFGRRTLEGIPHLRLVYEDDLATAVQQQATADRICAALGLEPAPVDSEIVRITPARAKDQVQNYAELAELLAVTRYARYLEG